MSYHIRKIMVYGLLLFFLGSFSAPLIPFQDTAQAQLTNDSHKKRHRRHRRPHSVSEPQYILLAVAAFGGYIAYRIARRRTAS